MNKRKKVLAFPKPPAESTQSTIVVQIGKERFAIHWEIEDMPPGSAAAALETSQADRAEADT